MTQLTDHGIDRRRVERMFGAAPTESAGVREVPDGRDAGPAEDVADVVAALDAANADVARAQRAFLRLIATASAFEVWRDDGARDLAHWLSMRYGISGWKARRWIDAAEELERLPAVDEAFTGGELSLDKTVELTRFATSHDEGSLVRWAADVSVATVRRRADRARVPTARGRRRRAEPPARVVVARGRPTSRPRRRVPGGPGGRRGERDPPGGRPAPRGAGRRRTVVGRRAPRRRPRRALLGRDRDRPRPRSGHGRPPLARRWDRHARRRRDRGRHGGPAVGRRAPLCDARVQVVREDQAGDVAGASVPRRDPPAWMVRQLRYRDRGCTFPGCGTNAFTQAHHIRWWSRGGQTDLQNLALVCSFHNRLVHEHGWAVRRERSAITWITPDGERYRARPRGPTST